jgi:G3E family GTPase
VVETTGVADPLQVGLTFLQTELRQKTSLDAVVTVVDCANFALDLFDSDAAMAQIVHGDVIVLNKIDLVGSDEVASLERRIGIIKPRARVLRAQLGRIPLDAILDLPQTGLMPVSRPAGHASHLLDDGFEAHTFRFEERISGPRLQAWLDDGLPAGVFRAKGLLRLAEPEGTFLFQLCGSRAAFEPWEDVSEISDLVFIGRELDRNVLSARLDACLVSRVPTAKERRLLSAR